MAPTMPTGCSPSVHDRQTFTAKKHAIPSPAIDAVCLPLLRGKVAVLLEMSLWISDLPGVHAGESVGDVVQRYHLAVPGLRGTKRFRQPVMPLSAHRFISIQSARCWSQGTRNTTGIVAGGNFRGRLAPDSSPAVRPAANFSPVYRALSTGRAIAPARDVRRCRAACAIADR